MKKRKLILLCIFIIISIFGICHYTIVLIEKEAIISFKRLHASYTQALDITANELGYETDCYFSTDKSINNRFDGCDRFYKKLSTNMKVTKYCKDNSLSEGCLPVYKNYTTKPACAGFSESMINRFNQTFVMSDKTTLTVFNQPSASPKPIFAVDTNGKFPPNKSGYDLFSFVIIRNSNGNYSFHPNITYCLPEEKGGIHKLQDIYK